MQPDFCADVKVENATAEGGNLGHLAAGRATETQAGRASRAIPYNFPQKTVSRSLPQPR